MDETPLAIIERAELAARERRLAAVKTVEAILVAADDRAREIEAGIPTRVEAALAELRQGHRDRADAALHDIERQLAELERRAGVDDVGARTNPRTLAAIELVVAAVLGEGGT